MNYIFGNALKLMHTSDYNYLTESNSPEFGHSANTKNYNSGMVVKK
jgi:hypothetical protein